MIGTDDHYLRKLRAGYGADAGTLRALARAVRFLDGPSFHLDLDVALAYGLTKHETGQAIVYSAGRGGEGDPLTSWVLPTGATITTVRGAAPEFTGRLDLAMSLMAENWSVSLVRDRRWMMVCDVTLPGGGSTGFSYRAKTLELAVVSAALEMRAALMGEGPA